MKNNTVRKIHSSLGLNSVEMRRLETLCALIDSEYMLTDSEHKEYTKLSEKTLTLASPILAKLAELKLLNVVVWNDCGLLFEGKKKALKFVELTPLGLLRDGNQLDLNCDLKNSSGCSANNGADKLVFAKEKT